MSSAAVAATRDRATHRRVGRGTRHGHRRRRRVVEHRDRHRRGGRLAPGRVARNGGQGVRAIGSAEVGPVKLDTARSLPRAERRAIQQELHAGHADVVDRGGGEMTDTAHGRARRGTRHAPRSAPSCRFARSRSPPSRSFRARRRRAQRRSRCARRWWRSRSARPLRYGALRSRPRRAVRRRAGTARW